MKNKYPDQREEAFEAVLDDLRGSGFKITVPRTTILRALFSHHGPFSAEDIYKRFAKDVCDVATVYRSLLSLEEAGMLKRCEFGDKTTRYELVGRDEHQHHHHVVCKECEKVEVLDDCELESIERFVKRRGYSDVSHLLEFFGVCRDCKRAS